MELGGLHHVTAVTADASGNVAFYTDVLGMRLVKKTVNQDDVSAYHLFYGDEIGNAGTEMTFFDWSSAGRHRPTAGEVSATAFRVAGRDALGWWEARFDDLGVSHGEVYGRGGRAVLPFSDPEGQRLELVDDSGDGGTSPGVPWGKSPVGTENGIRGLEGVSLSVGSVEPTEAVLTGVMGFRKVAEYEEDGHRAILFEVGPGGPGAEVRVLERPDLPSSPFSGAGGVHHVAFRTPDEEEHAAWAERVVEIGIPNSGLVERYYFKSLYFREPGGVLFEIATDGPGFATDEDAEHLGEKLALPPFLEPRREEIEAGLKPISR
ncbi:MAG: ring-cleaving dioxygenase [Rubrobacter sp.]|nr:ring-cleaving dioxygenase [Rubrobacter sp.]